MRKRKFFPKKVIYKFCNEKKLKTPLNKRKIHSRKSPSILLNVNLVIFFNCIPINTLAIERIKQSDQSIKVNYYIHLLHCTRK